MLARESWPLTDKTGSMEMWFLRRKGGKTLKEKIRNKTFNGELDFKPTNDHMIDGELIWFNHFCRTDANIQSKRYSKLDYKKAIK